MTFLHCFMASPISQLLMTLTLSHLQNKPSFESLDACENNSFNKLNTQIYIQRRIFTRVKYLVSPFPSFL